MRETIKVTAAYKIKQRLKDSIRAAGVPLAQRLWNHLPDKAIKPTVPVLGIALTRICNTDCTFCAYQFLDKSERISMKDELFEKLVAEIPRMGITTVELAPNLGDPLIAPRFLDKLDKLRAAGVTRITMSTNGVLLDKIGIDAYLERGPDVLYVSTSAFDEEMYKRLYRSDQYKRMRRNVLELFRKNHALPPERRKPSGLRIRSDKPPTDFMNSPDMVELEAIVDLVEWNSAYADWGGLIKPSMLTGNMVFEKMVPHENRPCAQLYYVVVHPDGEILACSCRNVHHDPDMSLGYLSEIDLRTAWDRLERVTTAWKNGKMPRTCATCTMYNDPALAWPGAAVTAGKHHLGRLLQLGRGPRAA